MTAAATANARVWMQAARAWTIERHPYLDVALSSMVLVPAPGLGTVAVDARWRLYFDPDRVLRLQAEHGIAALASDWVHEVMHLLRDHPTRWQALRAAPSEHLRWNVAADCHANQDVAELHLPILPTDITFDRVPEAAGCTRNMPTEEIYRRLQDHVTPATPTDCGSGTGGARRPWENSLDDTDDGSTDAGAGDLIRQHTAWSVRDAAKHVGAPGCLLRWADELLGPTVDWRRELHQLVSRHLSLAAGVRDYSYSHPARRKVPSFVLPGMVGPATPTIAAVVDTSGSMSADEIAACMSELVGMARAASSDNPGVWVIPCDAEPRAPVRVGSRSAIRNLTLSGGGGTDMVAGIDAAAALRPRPGVIVVLTDGSTDWPEHKTAALEGVKLIAALTDDGCADAVPSWIHTILIDEAARA